MQIDIKISLAVMDLRWSGDRDKRTFRLGGPDQLFGPRTSGVVARIVPFNHPLMFGCIKSVAPLIAGNAVIIKPSEYTPLSALRIEFAGNLFPSGIFNVLNGGGNRRRYRSIR